MEKLVLPLETEEEPPQKRYLPSSFSGALIRHIVGFLGSMSQLELPASIHHARESISPHQHKNDDPHSHFQPNPPPHASPCPPKSYAHPPAMQNEYPNSNSRSQQEE
ncbi:putative ribonuclease H protein [Senna tora]|uniref:Putative ribonuclease H protein n=1 Tax=Senna tora TaxID=362788 RepID=A0A834WJ10_9FABA|nr:putative ribonuclease H protein [Senna tora]